MHEVKVGELIHFYFLYLLQAKNGHAWVSLFKDDFFGYVFLRFSNSATSGNATDALIEYFKTVNPVLCCRSDQVPQLLNEMTDSIYLSKRAIYFLYSLCTMVQWYDRIVLLTGSERRARFEGLLNVPEARWPDLVHPVQYFIKTCSL